MMTSYFKQALLYTNAAILVGVAGFNYNHTSAQTSASCSLEKTISLEAVKRGCFSPQQYTSHIKNNPSVRNLMRMGALNDVLFEPSDEHLRSIYASKSLMSSAPMEALINRHHIERNSGASMFVELMGAEYGDRTPTYLFVNRRLFESPNIRNDTDIKIILAHELQHVADFYFGFLIGIVPLTMLELSQTNHDFLKHLTELRGYYRGLEEIRQNLVSGQARPSNEHFQTTLIAYEYHWKHLEQYISQGNETEQSVARLALKGLKIKPGQGYMQFYQWRIPKKPSSN